MPFNAAQSFVLAVLVILSASVLSGLAVYLRKSNGHQATAIADGIDAGMATFRHMPVVAALVGGGADVPVASVVRTTVPCSYLPIWLQKDVLLPDGQPDPQQYNDCGETCCSMVIAGVHGTPIEPGAIRQALGGPGRSGLTTADDLVQALAYYSVKSHVEALPAGAAWGHLGPTLAAGRPVIMLGTWPTPGGFLHWMLATECDSSKVTYHNPWSGVRSWLDQLTWSRLYAGSLVVVDSLLAYDCRKWPDPT